MTSASVSFHIDGHSDISAECVSHEDGGYRVVLDVGPFPAQVSLSFDSTRLLDEAIAKLQAARDTWALRRAADLHMGREGEP